MQDLLHQQRDNSRFSWDTSTALKRLERICMYVLQTELVTVQSPVKLKGPHSPINGPHSASRQELQGLKLPVYISFCYSLQAW